LPFAERRAVDRVEAAAVAIALEHAQHRGRQRRQQFAIHDGARLRAEKLDVERVAAPCPVQLFDHLVDAARLWQPRFALLGLTETRTVGDEDVQRAAGVRRDVDRYGLDHLVAAVGPQHDLHRYALAGARTRIVNPDAFERGRFRLFRRRDRDIDA